MLAGWHRVEQDKPCELGRPMLCQHQVIAPPPADPFCFSCSLVAVF